MELRQLDYFIAVSEELHFTKAAERLGISQPNLSLQIKALEAEIGSLLFDRLGKRIVLTEAGSVLLERAKAMFQNLRNARLEIEELRQHRGGSLSVGVVPSELDFRLTPLFIDFHRKYPHIRLKIFSSVEIVRQVLNNEIDVGVSVKPSYDSRLVLRPLSRQSYGVIVAGEHEWAARKSVSLSELREMPVILYPKGFWGRDLVDSYCLRQGFELNVVIETTSNPSLFRFVGENMGVTVQTESLVGSTGDPRLRFVPIHDHPPEREMAVIYRADKYLGHAAQAFIHMAEELLKDR